MAKIKLKVESKHKGTVRLKSVGDDGSVYGQGEFYIRNQKDFDSIEDGQEIEIELGTGGEEEPEEED